jgi:hypothetical protein
LIQVDALDAECPERTLAGLLQMVRVAIVIPPSPGTRHAALRRYDDVLRGSGPGIESLGKEALVVTDVFVVQAIHVGRVEEGDPRVHHRVDDADAHRFLRTAIGGQGHPAEADGGDVGGTGPQ